MYSQFCFLSCFVCFVCTICSSTNDWLKVFGNVLLVATGKATRRITIKLLNYLSCFVLQKNDTRSMPNATIRKVIHVRKLLRNTRVPLVDTKVKHRKVGNYCCYYFDKYSYFFKSTLK